MRDPAIQRVGLLVARFDVGGIQRQVIELAKGLQEVGVQPLVISVYPLGRFEAELGDAGVPAVSLQRSGRWEILPFVLRAAKTFRQSRLDIIYSFHLLPNLLSGILAPFLGGARVWWSLRATDLMHSDFSWIRRAQFLAGPLLARLFIDGIIANGYAVRDYHVRWLYPPHKMVVVVNGIDSTRYKRSTEPRKNLRSELGLPQEQQLVVAVGQFRQKKGQDTLIRAVASLRHQGLDCQLVLVGDGPQDSALKRLAQREGIRDHVRFVGYSSNPEKYYQAADVVCMPSHYGEGFPNVVAEAMACGAYVVASDVGDAARIINGLGLVVPPSDHKRLAGALRTAFDEQSRESPMAPEARQRRMVEHFDRSMLTRHTIRAFEARRAARS